MTCRNGDVQRVTRRSLEVERVTCRSGDVQRVTRRSGDVERVMRRSLDVEWVTCRSGDVGRVTCRSSDVEWVTYCGDVAAREGSEQDICAPACAARNRNTAIRVTLLLS